jgi:hypothetical protein
MLGAMLMSRQQHEHEQCQAEHENMFPLLRDVNRVSGHPEHNRKHSLTPALADKPARITRRSAHSLEEMQLVT